MIEIKGKYNEAKIFTDMRILISQSTYAEHFL